jgi:hypothetical protein
LPKKQIKFLKKLFAMMEGEMSLDQLDRMEKSGEIVGLHSTRERAAKWQFSKLDKNNNKVIICWWKILQQTENNTPPSIHPKLTGISWRSR